MSPAEHKLLMKLAETVIKSVALHHKDRQQLVSLHYMTDKEQKDRLNGKHHATTGMHSVCRDGVWTDTPLMPDEVAALNNWRKLQDNAGMMAQPCTDQEISDPATVPQPVQFNPWPNPAKREGHPLYDMDGATIEVMSRTHVWDSRINTWIPIAEQKAKFWAMGFAQRQARRQAQPRADRPINPHGLTKEQQVAAWHIGEVEQLINKPGFEVEPKWQHGKEAKPRPGHYSGIKPSVSPEGRLSFEQLARTFKSPEFEAEYPADKQPPPSAKWFASLQPVNPAILNTPAAPTAEQLKRDYPVERKHVDSLGIPPLPTFGGEFHYPPYWSAMNDQQRQRYMDWLDAARKMEGLK